MVMAQVETLEAAEDKRMEPVTDLLHAVLARAIKDAAGSDIDHASASVQNVIREAREWLRIDGRALAWEQEDPDPFSYVWVCDVLDLDPESVRRGVLAIVASGGKLDWRWCFAKRGGYSGVRRVPANKGSK